MNNNNNNPDHNRIIQAWSWTDRQTDSTIIFLRQAMLVQSCGRNRLCAPIWGSTRNSPIGTVPEHHSKTPLLWDKGTTWEGETKQNVFFVTWFVRERWTNQNGVPVYVLATRGAQLLLKCKKKNSSQLLVWDCLGCPPPQLFQNSEVIA